MEYKINLGLWNSVFAVPNSIIDEYIKLASGDNLKVLLYCLRHSGEKLSCGELSRVTGVAPDNVTSSVEFWQQRGLFGTGAFTAASGDSICEELKEKSALVILERDCEFSPKEISDTIKSSKDIEYLFKRGEDLYGRPLKHTEQKALAIIIEEVGMKPEVALMLMEFCFSIGKTTSSYIKKTAKNWIEQGIDSIITAESHIKQFKEYHSVEGRLTRLFEIKAIPEAKKPLIRKWVFELGLSDETIYNAYQKTLEKTGKLEYTYMDKILTGANKNGKPVQTKQSAPSSFDLDELDRQIMESYKNHTP